MRKLIAKCLKTSPGDFRVRKVEAAIHGAMWGALIMAGVGAVVLLCLAEVS